MIRGSHRRRTCLATRRLALPRRAQRGDGGDPPREVPRGPWRSRARWSARAAAGPDWRERTPGRSSCQRTTRSRSTARAPGRRAAASISAAVRAPSPRPVAPPSSSPVLLPQCSCPLVAVLAAGRDIPVPRRPVGHAKLVGRRLLPRYHSDLVISLIPKLSLVISPSNTAISVWPLATRYLTGRPGMGSKFTELAIDCADPGGLARFWCSVLDYEVQDEDDGIVTIGSPWCLRAGTVLARCRRR